MATRKKNVINNFFTKDWEKKDIIEKLGTAGVYILLTYGKAYI